MDASSLGAVIRAQREARGLSPYALGKRAGIAYVYLRRLEDGKTGRIGVDVFLRLCDALGADPMDVLQEAGWVSPGTVPRGELETAIGQLDAYERAFLLRMSRALLDLRRERVAAGAAVREPVAAYDREFPPGEEWPERRR